MKKQVTKVVKELSKIMSEAASSVLKSILICIVNLPASQSGSGTKYAGVVFIRDSEAA